MERIIFVLISIFCFTSVFAGDIDIFASAPENVKAVIKEADDLIAEKQYASAYGKISDSNEYFIYKKTDIAINYFAQSMMHQMFAFKNLSDGEDLMQIRRTGNNSQPMSMTMYNPEEVIENYIKEHGESPVLNLALSNYYADVLLRYGAQWLKTPKELYDLFTSNFDKAKAAGVYNVDSIWRISQACMRIRQYEKAIELYNLSLELNKENGADWYNLSVAYMYSMNYEKAIEAAKNAIKYPEEEVLSQIDAYLILSDAYSFNGDSKSAHKTIKDGRKKYDDNGALIRQQGKIYLRDEDYKNAAKEFGTLLKKNPEDRVYDSIINSYMYERKTEQAIAFTEKHLADFKDDSYMTFLMNYYLVQLYGDMEKNTECLSLADKSLELLEKTSLSYNLKSEYRSQLNKYKERLSTK